MRKKRFRCCILDDKRTIGFFIFNVAYDDFGYIQIEYTEEKLINVGKHTDDWDVKQLKNISEIPSCFQKIFSRACGL